MNFQHPPSHLDVESPRFEGTPHIWIQWKGTDVCCDVHCLCGAQMHYDGNFFYFFKCPHCGQHWEVGTHMPIYAVTPEQASDNVNVLNRDENMQS